MTIHSSVRSSVRYSVHSGVDSNGGAASDPLVFHGITFDTAAAADGSYDAYEMLDVKTGTGGLTETRTSTNYAPDHENIFRSFASGEAIYEGGRVVTNYNKYSQDFTQASYTALSATKTTGIADPNGGTTAVTLTATGANGCLQQITTVDIPDGDCIVSCWARRRTGTGTVRLKDGAGASGGEVDISPSLTSTWQRFVSGKASRSVNCIFKIECATSGDEIDVAFVQIESVVGRTDTTTPSEYIPTTTAAVTKVFANENGNSVASNVVTEATGSALASAPWVRAEPASTNSLTYSKPDAVNWSVTGTSVIGADATGLTGATSGAMSAVVLTDDDGAAYEYVSLSNVIAADTSTHCVRVFIKKDADESRYPLVFAFLNAGTSSGWHINTATGASSEASGSGGDCDVRSAGDWWDVVIAVTNGGAATQLQSRLYPASGTVFGTPSTAATGSITVGNVELHLNTSIAAVRGSSPIFTSGSAVSTVATDLSFDDANHSDTQGAWYAEHETRGRVNQHGFLLLGSSGRLMYADLATTLKAFEGSAIASVAALNNLGTSGNQNKIAVAYGGSNMRVNANGTWGTAAAYDGAFNNSLSKIVVCGNATGGASESIQLIRNIRRYDLDYDAAQTQISSLMS